MFSKSCLEHVSNKENKISKNSVKSFIYFPPSFLLGFHEAPDMPSDFLHCSSTLMAFAAGSAPVTLPKDAGFPLADSPETTYMMLKIHYDNPELVEDIVDSSGYRLYVTDQLRKYDASILEVGSVPDYRLFIPPGLSNLVMSGHCDPRCLEDVSVIKTTFPIF